MEGTTFRERKPTAVRVKVNAMQPQDILLLVFMICGLIVVLVAMALGHQRKLAEIAAQSHVADESKAEGLSALQASVDELRRQLHAQMIQVDTLVDNQAKMLERKANPEELRQRLGGDEPTAS